MNGVFIRKGEKRRDTEGRVMSRQRQRVERWVYKPRKVRRSARS